MKDFRMHALGKVGFAFLFTCAFVIGCGKVERNPLPATDLPTGTDVPSEDEPDAPSSPDMLPGQGEQPDPAPPASDAGSGGARSGAAGSGGAGNAAAGSGATSNAAAGSAAMGGAAAGSAAVGGAAAGSGGRGSGGRGSGGRGSAGASNAAAGSGGASNAAAGSGGASNAAAGSGGASNGAAGSAGASNGSGAGGLPSDVPPDACAEPALDSDADGTPDCSDLCPLDQAKVTPGICGCGAAEADTDNDQVLDCQDGCPLDLLKLAPGVCGCSVSEADSDGDGTPDCQDSCPADAAKLEPLSCGCGVPDSDQDANGTVDCQQCPADPNACAPSDPTKPSYVDITWFSVSNVLYEIGSLGVVTDGYVTRIPESNFYGGSQGLAYTYQPSVPDTDAVGRVLQAFGGPSAVDLLLTGHSHFDHAFDTAAWAKLTGAPVMGSKTTCFQVQAQGIPAADCTALNGGEAIELTEHVTVRVVRWNHSGSTQQNPEQHSPVELESVPVLDPATGGLRAGVAEDFPNGGGGRAYLFTVDAVDGPLSWFFQNSAGESDLAEPIVVDGVNYGAPLDNLRNAMAEAGLNSVDLWIGTGGTQIARLVQPILLARAYLPVHWDDFEASFWAGAGRGYSDSSLASYLAGTGAVLLQPQQYFDKFRLDTSGVRAVDNSAIKAALGFANP